MPDLRQVAREKALKYRIDPNVFVRQIGAESGFRTRARSGAGAQGIAQIMPDTARAWGVNPHDPVAALDAAAKNMAKYIRKHGSYERALRAYNAGEGAIDKSYKYAETNAYVQKILGGREPKAPVGNARGTQGSAPKLGSTPERTVTTVTGESEADQRLAILSGYLAQRGRPGALIGLGTGLANIVPQTTTTTRVPGIPTPTPAPRSARASAGSVAPGGKLLELFWRGPGSINAKNGQRVGRNFVSGHEGHVHVAASPHDIVKLAKMAQRMGLRVGENPAFGGVAPVHVANSNHYAAGRVNGKKVGKAIDVSGDPAKMRAFAHRVAQTYGVK